MRIISCEIVPCALPVRRFGLAAAVFMFLALLGCQAGPGASFVKPTIAVLKFENKAPFPYQWDLGGGTRDVLTDRLVKTDRYHVIERPELDGVMREINLENTGLTRAQDKAKEASVKGNMHTAQVACEASATDSGS